MPGAISLPKDAPKEDLQGLSVGQGTMTQAAQPQQIITHHCRECGEHVSEDGFCAAHPKEVVDSVLSTVHPLRAAVEEAEAALAVAQEALDAILEPADDCAEGHRVSEAEDRLRETQLALVGSGCPREWKLREGGYDYHTVTATSAEAALKIARDNVDRSYYPDCTGTLWIIVSVRCEETGETESGVATLDEDEPTCEAGHEHAWCSPHALVGGLEENPGVHGNGGGVIITEVCRHCGCKRTTDTWAQNPETGEQGLRSVEYEEDAYTAEELAAVEWE